MGSASRADALTRRAFASALVAGAATAATWPALAQPDASTALRALISESVAAQRTLDPEHAKGAFLDPLSDAYGEKRDGLSQRIPKKHFGAQKLEPGMQVVLQTNFGPRAVTIQKVGMSVVDVDLNHPMAGKDLDFDIEVVEVREASAEELAHGHVHGEGGHHH